MAEHPFPAIIESLRRAAATLREADIPFVLGGSLAAWARGGPETTKDLDLLVRPEHAEAALEALSESGLRTERPPEEWLYKAWDGDVLIDVIFRLTDQPVDDAVFARADELKVAAVKMPVMALEDMLIARLLSLDDHHLDLAPLVLIARSLREQIAWDYVRERTAASPYARGYLTIVEGLGLVEGAAPAGGDEVTVRAAPGEEDEAPAFGPTPGEPH